MDHEEARDAAQRADGDHALRGAARVLASEEQRKGGGVSAPTSVATSRQWPWSSAGASMCQSSSGCRSTRSPSRSGMASSVGPRRLVRELCRQLSDDGRQLPDFVEREISDCLSCGDPEQGFA